MHNLFAMSTGQSKLSNPEVFGSDFTELLMRAPTEKAVIHYVHHNYQDRAKEQPSFIDPQYWLRIKASAASPFPVKLYHMLEQVENDGLPHIVSWQPHGRCFLIHKQKEFICVILPRYMNLNKFASFQRQLNLYGFGRITQGLDKGGYYHEFLLRGKGPLALEVQRAKVKGTCVRGKSNPLEEPNFWIMPWLQGSLPADMAMEQNMSIAQQPPTKAVAHLYMNPIKVECRSIVQPFTDIALPSLELNPKCQQKDMFVTKRFQPQSTLQGNQLFATTHFQSQYASTGTKESFPSCITPLTTFTTFQSNFNPLSDSLGIGAFGEYYDIEPLSPGASSEDDIFLDKMDLLDMLERVKSL